MPLKAQDKQSLRKTNGDVPKTLARDANEIMGRRELVSCHHPGIAPAYGETTAGDKWVYRYAKPLRHPYVWGRGVATGIDTTRVYDGYGDCHGEPSTVEFVVQLSGLYDTRLSYVEDEPYEDTAEKSISGYVRVQGQILQQKDGAATWGVVADTAVSYEPLRFVFVNASGSCHYLWVQANLLRDGLVKESFTYREGMLDLTQDPTTSRTGTDDTILTVTGNQLVLKTDLESDFDPESPFRVVLDVEIHHRDSDGNTSYETYPQFLDDEAAASVPKSVAGVPYEDRMYVDLIGFSAWMY